MATEFKLSYTGSEVNEKLGKIDGLVEADKNLASEIAVERARINSFTALAEGSTTGDAELQDIRVAVDGMTYSTAGEAVRGQVSDLKNTLGGSTRNLLNPRLMYQGTYHGVTYTYSNGRYTANGTATGSGSQYSNNLGLIAGQTYTFCAFSENDIPINGYIRTFDSNNTTLQTTKITNTNTPTTVTLDANTAKTVWSFGLVSGTTYSDCEFRFQCTEGSSKSDYISYFTAVDAVAREDMGAIKDALETVRGQMSDLENDLGNVADLYPNIFDANAVDAVKTGYFLRYNGDYSSPATNDGMTMLTVPVRENTQYICTGTSYRTVFLDGKYNIISCTTDDSGTDKLAFSTPENCSYVVLNIRHATYPVENYMVAEGEHLPTSYIGYGVFLSDNLRHPKSNAPVNDLLETIDGLKDSTAVLDSVVEALNNGIAYNNIDLTFYQGAVHDRNYSNPLTASGTIYSNLIENKNMPIHIFVPDGYKALIVEFDNDYNHIKYQSWITGDVDSTIDNPYASIELRPTAGGDISPSEGYNLSASYVIGVALSGANSIAYVSTSGSDSNDGISRTTPFATIQKAINSGAKNILVKEGVYTQGFTLNDKEGVNIILDHYYDSFTIGTDEDNPKIIIDGTENSIEKGAVISNCINCKFGNIEVRNTTLTGFTVQRCDGLRFDDCIAHDIGVASPSGNVGGFMITRTNADFYNCVAYNIGTTTKGTQAYHCDGFNIHYTGTTNFINCKAWNCEDDGISHHDACYGLVDGGEWYNCGKGGIATPTHGAKVNISNVYCHDNNVGIYAGNDNAVTDRGNLIFSNCVCKNNDNKDMIISDYYKVIAINCIYDTVTGADNITRFGTTA